MSDRYRVTNISAERGVLRVWIPISQGVVLRPAKAKGRRRVVRRSGSCSAIVGESLLRRLVGYYRKRQMAVEKIGGGTLPIWLMVKASIPAPAPPVTVEEPPKSPPPAPSPPKEIPVVEDEVDVAKILELPAKDVIAFVESSENDDLLYELLEAESAKDTKSRKTVVAAIEKALEEL